MTNAQRAFLVLVAFVAIVFTFWPLTKLPYETLYSLYGIENDDIVVLRGVTLEGAFVALYKALGR